MKKKTCLYPGSFDPPTRGHLDIIRRAAAVFDEVVVGVLHNPDKQGAFSVEKRLEMLEKCCAGLENVRLVSFGGLTAELARQMEIQVLVRGVRGVGDLESETAQARINRQLNPALETVFFPASPDKTEISSSFVKQLAAFGAPLEAYIPDAIIEDVKARFSAPDAH